MIERLLSLELTNFRGYREATTVPLDADVVLIHGANGCGKSSLLQALELAVTGDVSDLRPYKDSYPRCLQNIGVTGSPRVSLRYRSERGDEVEQTASKPPFVEGQQLSKKETAFFADRCYLSQARLGRLLELYQAVDKHQPEAPLVTFIRELLGLDYLEHLTAGLDEIGLITRVRKSVPALQQLEAAYELAAKEIDRLQENFRNRALTLTTEIDECRKIAREDSGDPVPLAPWTVAGVRQRLDTLRAASSAQTGSSLKEQIQHDQTRLALIAEFVQAAASPADRSLAGSSLAELDHREAATRLELQTRETQLLEVAEAARRVLSECEVKFTLRETSSGIAADVEQWEEIVQRELTRCEADIAAAAERQQELHTLARQLESATAELQSLPTQADSPEDDLATTWLSALKTFLPHVHHEDCPVCGRDYSELHAGELRDRIETEIQRRESQAGEQLAARQLRADRQQKVTDLTLSLERARSNAATILTRGAAARATTSRLRSLAEQLAQGRSNRERWQQLQSTLNEIGLQRRNAEAIRDQQAKYRTQLDELADRWKLPPDRPADATELSRVLSELLLAQYVAAQQREAMNRVLQGALERVVNLAFEQEAVTHALAQATAEQANRTRARQRVDGHIHTARDLRKEVLCVKGEILSQVFNGTLNRLWRELFERLVKVEPFQPWLAEPESTRGRMHAQIQGLFGKSVPFADLAAILSCGNLNTAALSLFLALHLIEPPKHRVLVFDDPVQNMDDVKAMQLAGLLRAIVLQANRQLVIAVHERPLFEYLCLELGPTRRDESLIAIELSRHPQNLSVQLHHTLHTWQPDRIRFTA